jgi:cytochrome c biogenesis protein CcmG/thiol:disulfide interchange protein DsbE
MLARTRVIYMSRWIAVLPLVVLAALAFLFVGYGLHHDPHVQPQALVGKPMPDLSLASLDDSSRVHLRDSLNSGPIVVNFFASWCGPCELDQPSLLYLRQKGVRIVGIDYEDVPPRGSTEAARDFLRRLGDPFFRRLVDPDGRAGIDFGITGVPETYLVSASGRILAKHTGPMSKADADELAARALAGR